MINIRKIMQKYVKDRDLMLKRIFEKEKKKYELAQQKK